MLPLDLHVLSLSLAFILSQDQTLHCYFCFVIILLCDSLDVLVLIIGSTYIRVLFRSGRLLKRSILPRIRSHALISLLPKKSWRALHNLLYIKLLKDLVISPLLPRSCPSRAEPVREANVTAKVQKLFWLLQHFEENFLSSSSQPSLI